jgi:hypothetical protein
MLLLAVFLVVFQSFSSCTHPKLAIDACVVDSLHLAYECVDFMDEAIHLPFDAPNDLSCSSPQESEGFLKACKVGQVKEMPLCSYRNDAKDFRCTQGKEMEFLLSIDQVDNYLCFSSQHRKRILERCNQNQKPILP